MQMNMNKPKILLVTSKWGNEEHDGGLSTAIDICESISELSHLDVLIPSYSANQKRKGIENVISYEVPDKLIKENNGQKKFYARIRLAKIITPILLSIIDQYDKIIVAQ